MRALALLLVVAGCSSNSIDRITLEDAQNLSLRMELKSNFFLVDFHYDFSTDSRDCQYLASVAVTLAGDPLIIDPGVGRDDNDGRVYCQPPAAYTDVIPNPFLGPVVITDPSLTITCDAPVMDGPDSAHFDCDGITNSIRVFAGAPPLQ